MKPYRRKLPDGRLTKNFYASYWQGGRHRIRCLHTADEQQAKRLAGNLHESLQHRRSLLTAQRVLLESTSGLDIDDLRQCQTLIDEKIRQLGGDKRVTLDEVMASVSPRHRVKWAKFREFLGKDKKFFADVESGELAKHLQELTDEGYSSHHVNCLRRLVGNMWQRFGRRAGAVNPVTGTKAAKSNAQSREALTQAQVSLLLHHATPDIATMIRLGWATALRLGDMLTLRWNEVAVTKDGSVIVEKVQNKTQKKVRVVLAAGSGRWLMSLPRETDGFVAPGKLRKRKKQNLVKAFGALLLKVGIAPNVAVKGLRNRVRKYGFHSLRHGAATHMAGLSASAPTISAALGHNSLAMTHRYLAHSSPQQDALMSKAAPDIELLNEHQESQP